MSHTVSPPGVATPPAVLPQANDPCWCGSGRKYKRCHKRSEGRVLPGVVSPMRTVPAHIERPPYADTGDVESWDEPRVKSSDTIERMRVAGKLAAEILRLAGEAVRPGMTTDELDAYVHELYIERDCYPSPLNYNGYPKSVCTSVNEVICHGIPDSRPLEDGDIVNLDVTAYHGGVHGDTNATFFVGDVDEESRQLVRVTEEATWHGIEAVQPGRPLSDIGRAIEQHAKKYKLRRDPGVHRARHRRAVPLRHPGAALLRLAQLDDHAGRDDVHDRADDQPRHVAAQDVGRRLDRGHRPTASARRSSSTPWSSPTTASTCSPAGPAPCRRPRPGTADRRGDHPEL